MANEVKEDEAKTVTAIRTGEIIRVSNRERKRAQLGAAYGAKAKGPTVEFTNRIKELNAIDRKELPHGASNPKAAK